MSLSELPPHWFSQDWKNLFFAGLVLGIVFVERRYHVVNRIKNLNDYTRNYLQFVLFISITLAWLLVQFGLDFEYGLPSNIILFRAFNYYGYGHWLIWLAEFAVWCRFGYKDIVRGFIYAGILAAVHEGFWFLCYFIAEPQNFLITVIYYSPLFALLLSFGVAYWFLLAPKDKLSYYQVAVFLGVVAMFDFLWALAGFHITADNILGITQYFKNIDVNLNENDSWWVPAFVLITFRKVGQSNKKVSQALNLA